MSHIYCFCSGIGFAGFAMNITEGNIAAAAAAGGLCLIALLYAFGSIQKRKEREAMSQG